MPNRRPHWSIVLVIGAAACAATGGPASPSFDAFGVEAGTVDASVVDGGIVDGGVAADGSAASGPCPAGHVPTDPIDYGTCEVMAALSETQSSATVRVVLASDPIGAQVLVAAGIALGQGSESYAITAASGTTYAVGRDPVGAMYGALDVAERLRDDGAGAIPLAQTVTAAPAVALRGANLFLALPTAAETTSTWWFRDPSFWTEYLDMMAHARLDFLDIHAMYDPVSTSFPDALPYFATSASFPNESIDPADLAANVAMLQQIVAMAAVRGIRVGLMSYGVGGLATTALTDPELQTYTRETVTDLVAHVPGLWRLGFRIGESGQAASWYTATYVATLDAADAGVAPYTRTWGTTKPELLTLVAASSRDTILEAKFNGEQFAAPYPIAGASFATFGGYSYQDYLQPPSPYGFVFQLRSGGTHRIFRFSHYDRARRAALSVSMSPRVTGMSFEAAHAYYPQRDFYHAPQDVFSPWTFRRDELAYHLMGRLAYDATTPEARFRSILAARVGTDALWDPMQAASDIVPWIQTAMTCGADQRDYAPELELGGNVAWWASPTGTDATCYHHIAFDGFAVAMPAEVADDLVAARATTRLSPAAVALTVLADAQAARAAAQVTIDPTNAEARDVARECTALADLGEWFAHKLRGATALAVYQRTALPDWLAAARSETALADAAFQQLATDTAYIAPFDEHIRMIRLGLPTFHWSEELSLLADDPASIDVVAQQVAQSPPTFTGTLPPAATWLDAVRLDPPGLVGLVVSPVDASAPSWTVGVTLASAPPAGAAVHVLWKPLDSETDWTIVDAGGAGAAWSATVAGGGEGGLFAVEIEGPPGQGWRLPDVMKETPYRVLAP